MHAWVAARLGHIAEAYELFIYAATIDLDDHKGNVRDGIHAACCGGVWQAVVFGFCGLELTENGFTTDAKLPSHWQRVAFKVQHHGKTHAIEIKNTAS
jgi:kojibiose phosphorylase